MDFRDTWYGHRMRTSEMLFHLRPFKFWVVIDLRIVICIQIIPLIEVMLRWSKIYIKLSF